MAPYTRPENVLRRAEELVGVNQPHAALTAIGDILLSKRSRSIPVTVLEPIMIRFIDLALQLGRMTLLKEGFHAYKNNLQNSEPASISKVIHYYVDRAKEKLDVALQEVSAPDKTASPDEVEDLEAPDTPESLAYAALIDDTSQQEVPDGSRTTARTARSTLAPALRQLWSAYRTSLDLVRNNNKLEPLYHQLATDLFAFCVTHRRRTELRRACDTLRQHLVQIQRSSSSNHIDINKPETLHSHIETRFHQLNAAVELELWQEAFRTAEDVNSLFALSRRPIKPSSMIAYYGKLVSIFAVGDNPLYRAAAYTKLLAFTPDNSNTPGKDKDSKANVGDDEGVDDLPIKASNLADHVLLSLLAVPDNSDASAHADDFSAANPATKPSTGPSRLASMLNLSSEPTRKSLLQDALARNVLKRACSDVRELYTLLEVKFDPLSITKNIEPIIQRLAQDSSLRSYLDPLRKTLLARLFQQLGHVYDVLDIDRAVKFASGAESVFLRTQWEQQFEAESSEGESSSTAFKNGSRYRVECMIADACRRHQLEVTIDHDEHTVDFTRASSSVSSVSEIPLQILPNFGDISASDTPNYSPVAPASLQVLSTSEALQPPVAAMMRSQLSRLACALSFSLAALTPATDSKEAKLANCKAQALAHLTQNMENEREELLKRRQIIDHRLNNAREAAARREGHEAHAKQVLQHQRMEEERKRLKDVQDQKAQATLENEKKKARQADNERLIQELRERGRIDVTKNVDLSSLERTDLLQMSVEAIEKEKNEMNARLTVIGKRLDHFERAQREEEIPLLKLDKERQAERDRELFETEWKNRVEEMKNEYARKVELKKRFSKMEEDYSAYVAKIAGERDAVNAQRRKEADENIAKEKENRINSLREKKRLAREEEERARVEREEEEARRREQREREAAEEAERARREAEEKALADERRRAREEDRAKLDEQSRRQREVEESIEARQAAKRQVPGAAAQAAPAGGASAWRRPEPERAPTAASTGGPTSWRRPEPPKSQTPSPTTTPAPSGTSAPWRPSRVASGSADRPPSKFPGKNTPPPMNRQNGSTDNDGFQTVKRKDTSGSWR